jgi:glutamyl-tRNA reductase
MTKIIGTNDAGMTQTLDCKGVLKYLCAVLLLASMHKNHKHSEIDQFTVAGINYKKTDASVRGLFAINDEQYGNILELAKAAGIQELFVLSTCNRTEIYALCSDKEQLTELLCSQASGDRDTFEELAYIKSGFDAVQHLFNVSAGLDSQILGDYEILGQIKKAVKFAKGRGFIGTFTERLINSMLQSSKAIKTETQLSGGTVSVSFAAVQYIKDHYGNIQDKKILLVGTGKIGHSACKNLVDYLQTKNITLINRTEDKAAQLAEEMGLSYAPISQLDEAIAEADIILVSTGAEEPIVLSEQLEGTGEKLIIDLSIPCNVEAKAGLLPNVTLVNVDELSKIKDETLAKRRQEVPKAMEIISEHMQEFTEWYDLRKHVPILREVKSKLQEIETIYTYGNDSKEKIQKVLNSLALKMRNQATPGCQYIQAINEFIA